jgi:hypothetical protein
VAFAFTRFAKLGSTNLDVRLGSGSSCRNDPAGPAVKPLRIKRPYRRRQSRPQPLARTRVTAEAVHVCSVFWQFSDRIAPDAHFFSVEALQTSAPPVELGG